MYVVSGSGHEVSARGPGRVVAGERQESGRGRRDDREELYSESYLWGKTGVTRDEVCDIAENATVARAGVYSLLMLDSVLPSSSFPFARASANSSAHDLSFCVFRATVCARSFPPHPPRPSEFILPSDAPAPCAPRTRESVILLVPRPPRFIALVNPPARGAHAG